MRGDLLRALLGLQGARLPCRSPAAAYEILTAVFARRKRGSNNKRSHWSDALLNVPTIKKEGTTMKHRNKLLGLGYLSIAAAAVLIGDGMAVAQTFTDDEPAAASFPDVDQKIRRLKKRVKQLEADVGELQALNLPAAADVNCSAGGSVNAVIAAHANGRGALTIRITGTCTETIIVNRSDVTLLGQAGATVQAAGTNFGLLVTDGERNVDVADLRFVGGQGAAAVSKDAHVIFTNIVVEQTNLGVVSADNGTIDITRSLIRNNNIGVYAARGGVTLVSNSIVENNTTGILAFKDGMINVTSLAPDGTAAPAGVTVRNNTNGGVARSGGTIELSDARIENNTSVGLLADSTSALHFFNPINGTGNVVTGHPTVGVLVQKTASVVFGDSTTTITGNNIGILCNANAGYVLPPGGSPGNVTGNTAGNIVGCLP